MCELIGNIDSFIKTIGKGQMCVIPYDTAVVALIPSFEDINKPQFPQTLQWIRDNQLPDGSWGTTDPCFAHSSILNTLASIISLKKWQINDNDNEMIKKGEKSVRNLIERLKEETNIPNCYELIIPNLCKFAKKLNIDIPFASLETKEETDQKIADLKVFHKKYGYKKIHIFWYCLEAIEYLELDKEFYEDLNENMLDINGFLCNSPAATSGLLRMIGINRKIDVPKICRSIESIIDPNGGVPAVYSLDAMEIGWCALAFIKGGISPCDEIMKPLINQMIKIWNQSKGLVGGSATFPADGDCIAVYIFVLKLSNFLNETNDSLKTLMDFYDGQKLLCYQKETIPSVSANLHSLMALKLFDSSLSQQMIGTMLEWIRTQTRTDDMLFEDKWHFSPFYSISEAVFGLQGLDDELCEVCIEKMVTKQKSDGGYGIGNNSTLEETSIVVLSLCFWFETNPHLINENIIKIFKSIDNFYKTFSGDQYVKLWVAKTLYCLPKMIDSNILSAKYSLSKFINKYELKNFSQNNL